ncbi:MAG: aminotransferase class V-fold PLP-dependent enzyme [Candidatus Eisenbacteria sp.]|nr:aminotransferase class V-fold PLP-dependent enzyme [Candidatus Eisenbacteria bacterium]
MNPFIDHWLLDRDITHLNHGSFGACPIPVLAVQDEWRRRMERNPVGFFGRELDGRLDAARETLGRFVGVAADDLALLPNVTIAVNTVLRALPIDPGDEILTSDHEYNACRTALEFVAQRRGARIVVAALPFPASSAEELAAAFLAGVTARTRLALLDHVTSPTGLVMPVGAIVRELEGRGITTLVDGAHAPGMLPVSIAELGCAFYAGNCHKWICAPKGVGFLYVRADRQAALRPLVISHGANARRRDRPRFRLEFDWTGTHDPSGALALPAALDFMGDLLPGGWPELQAHNHALVCEGRRLLCAALDIAPPCPEELLGSLAAIPLPWAEEAAAGDGQAATAGEVPAAGTGQAAAAGGVPAAATTPPRRVQAAAEEDHAPRAVPPVDDPLERLLFDHYRIVVPVFRWPQPRLRLLRISAQIYNRLEDYQRLADALRMLLRP